MSATRHAIGQATRSSVRAMASTIGSTKDTLWVRTMLGRIAELGRKYLPRRAGGSPVDTAIALCHDLFSARGEASGMAIAREITELYRRMPDPARAALIERIVNEFGVDEEELAAAARDFAVTRGSDAYLRLAAAVEPPTQELFRRINIAPGATGAIVKMREHLLRLLPDHPELRRLDADLKHLLHSWFNRGFLEFERIDWHTPAAVLEKLIEYEAVHQIAGWDDLRRRLAGDRRCFAFFHPALPGEPLIFVEVALTHGLPGEIASLIDSPPSDQVTSADTAVFYSISNCQPGLAGISFGNLLIKQVVDAISSELPKVTTFATLSPVPGFRRWIDTALRNASVPALTAAERTLLAKIEWLPSELARPDVKHALRRLCAHFLVNVKQNGQVPDPVARFHLRNGASIDRINAAADLSEKGIRQSAGTMVNYLYGADDIVANHEGFAHDGRIALSPSIRKLLGSGRNAAPDRRDGASGG